MTPPRKNWRASTALPERVWGAERAEPSLDELFDLWRIEIPRIPTMRRMLPPSPGPSMTLGTAHRRRPRANWRTGLREENSGSRRTDVPSPRTPTSPSRRQQDRSLAGRTFRHRGHELGCGPMTKWSAPRTTSKFLRTRVRERGLRNRRATSIIQDPSRQSLPGIVLIEGQDIYILRVRGPGQLRVTAGRTRTLTGGPGKVARCQDPEPEKSLLAAWPLVRWPGWVEHVSGPHTEAELAALRRGVQRGSPFGQGAGATRLVRRRDWKARFAPKATQSAERFLTPLLPVAATRSRRPIRDWRLGFPRPHESRPPACG